MKELELIQKAINCPKDRKAGTGYNYRSCSDIFEAFKKCSNGCTLTVSDKIIEIGGHLMVEATATVTNPSGERESAVGYADLGAGLPKGMDNAAKWTGACSSYARKYAMNGLLAIDDIADPDALDAEEPKPTKSKKNTEVKPAAAPQPVQKPRAANGKRIIEDSAIQSVIDWACEKGLNLDGICKQVELTQHQLEVIKSQIH